MSRFYNVRGFIDCDYPELEKIREIVRGSREGPEASLLEPDTFDLYTAGWLYQERKMNWVAHAFFGGSMRRPGVDLIFSHVTSISEEIPDAEGVFFIESDEGDNQRWIMSHGRVNTLHGKGF
ncbi:hypothetical protein [Streptomyces cacaoi]|uniref:hypothetical protein n=1 Tax=Streptomyces cacaoi TaxID=1898 RepID=UPI00332C5484